MGWRCDQRWDKANSESWIRFTRNSRYNHLFRKLLPYNLLRNLIAISKTCLKELVETAEHWVQTFMNKSRMISSADCSIRKKYMLPGAAYYWEPGIAENPYAVPCSMMQPSLTICSSPWRTTRRTADETFGCFLTICTNSEQKSVYHSTGQEENRSVY